MREKGREILGKDVKAAGMERARVELCVCVCVCVFEGECKLKLEMHLCENKLSIFHEAPLLLFGLLSILRLYIHSHSSHYSFLHDLREKLIPVWPVKIQDRRSINFFQPSQQLQGVSSYRPDDGKLGQVFINLGVNSARVCIFMGEEGKMIEILSF